MTFAPVAPIRGMQSAEPVVWCPQCKAMKPVSRFSKGMLHARRSPGFGCLACTFCAPVKRVRGPVTFPNPRGTSALPQLSRLAKIVSDRTGVNNRAERLAIMSRIIGRTIKTTKELSSAEADYLIKEMLAAS